MGKLDIMDGAAIVDWVRSVQPVWSLQNTSFLLAAGVHTRGARQSSCNIHLAWQVLRCQHSCGGFGGSERHDAHLLYTLSAIQVLALYDKLHLINADQVSSCES